MPPSRQAWGILSSERRMAVGPKRSQPCEGEQPSASGFPARRPEGRAPMDSPCGTLEETGYSAGILGLPRMPLSSAWILMMKSHSSMTTASTSGSSLPHLGASSASIRSTAS